MFSTVPATIQSDVSEQPLRVVFFGSACAMLLCFSALALTSPGLPMGWDEGNAILRAEGISRWAERWVDWTRGEAPCPLQREITAEDWRYTTQIEGHPAFYGTVIAVGQGLGFGRLSPLGAARLGPILLFSLAAAGMYWRLARSYSQLAAACAVGALLLQPRLFAHLHFASFDGPLVSCWILAWAAFDTARRYRWGIVIWAVALGTVMSCKATGWLAPLPFLAWAALYRDRAGWRAILWGLPAALLVFVALNPTLWHAPVDGLRTFFELNWQRQQFNIPTQFFGELYHRGRPLPWYNTLLWTAITVPLGLLLLGVLGLFRAIRDWRVCPTGTLLVLCWLVLLVVRAMPFAPPHDAIRLFLPSFAFLAAIIGIGCEGLVLRRTSGSGHGTRLVLAAVFVGCLHNLVWYQAQWLSHYNLAIGGLSGATTAGMEPTYYWDGLDDEVLDWLAANTTENQKVRFGSPSNENLRLMRRWGTLPVEYRTSSPGSFHWYVMQNRPSVWSEADRWLLENAEPAYQKKIRSGGWGPWRIDVPLVSVYAYDDHLTAVKVTNQSD